MTFYSDLFSVDPSTFHFTDISLSTHLSIHFYSESIQNLRQRRQVLKFHFVPKHWLFDKLNKCNLWKQYTFSWAEILINFPVFRIVLYSTSLLDFSVNQYQNNFPIKCKFSLCKVWRGWEEDAGGVQIKSISWIRCNARSHNSREGETRNEKSSLRMDQ